MSKISRNPWLDKIYFRYTIIKKSGETEDYEMSLREYIKRKKEDILIGISFPEAEWSEPVLIINL